ncbi:hypothetical protein SynSYN20_01906 [Synechococcus sp. SYN20]|nr:hypothetical protein SynSYN20_01906 [Synechococcus sp. SYN20]
MDQARGNAPTAAQNSTTLYASGAFVCMYLQLDNCLAI